MSSRRRLPSALCTALVVLFLVNCCHANHHRCDQYSSSCGGGNIVINISYPFRFEGDPENCGNKKYELTCQNNRPILQLPLPSSSSGGGGKYYYVLAINYDNYTIRLVDTGIQKGNCSSLPLYPLSYENFTGPSGISYSDGPIYDLFMDHSQRFLAVAMFVDCKNPVNSPFYVDTATTTDACIKKITRTSSSSSSSYSYFVFGNSLEASDVADLCEIKEIVTTTLLSMTPPPGATEILASSIEPDYHISRSSIRFSSFLDFRTQLASGFELSWQGILCEKCPEQNDCSIDEYFTVTCYNPKCYGGSKKTFQCKLEQIAYDYVFPALEKIGFILGPRTSVGMLCLFAFLIYKFRTRHLSMFDTIEGFLQSQNNLTPIRYSYWEIKMMTKNFKEKLGQGGYGSVYKGKLRSGHTVAVKILSKSKANGQEFINEVATIGRIHHFNVVQLIGFCAKGSKRALVYDFMPNGSLEKYIFTQEMNISLSCKQMYDISLGVARGIEYLHYGCDMQILHFDIKPHNILLDENFTPKVSDFGLAKLYPTDNSIVSLTAARGTMGYMAPELFYKNIGRVSYKADIYSFGMLLMEMTGRRRNLNPYADHTSQIYFPSWVYDQFKEGMNVEMGETTEEERQMVRKMIITALWCIQMKPADRPSMNKVVEMLEGNVELLQMPPKPFLTPQEMPAEDN